MIDFSIHYSYAEKIYEIQLDSDIQFFIITNHMIDEQGLKIVELSKASKTSVFSQDFGGWEKLTKNSVVQDKKNTK